ncbi:hypothetical protein WMY93_019977 [Mugilogobius chulae]|uniref:C2H2-type domain-containing protein n=1 Tax=Mugilogobius chulae TaxID=88201 RepID=A0AAW0NLM3_9GOBI
MLPGAHQGRSYESELFNSLKAHLNNRNRLQPFIGLSSIIECVNGSAPQRDVFFICEVCVCRLDKADMRNHIMGSLHRYNYIKTRHPELVSELGEDSCLSKLAWPLMDIAKRIEGKEGTGNVQVVEFDRTSYQQMESQTNNAKKVIDFLRDTLKETEPEISEKVTSKIWEQTVKSPSQRIVLYSPRNKPVKDSPQQSDVSESSSTSLEGSSSFLSDYEGQTPLIGLVRVIECRSEDGQTHCFLCHCCRVRSHKHDFISHLTSTSHITNYLLETHPEQLDTVDLNDSHQVVLLAENLNKEEANKTLKMVQIPEALCIQMTSKSYHWCVKKLGWNNSNFPVKYIDVKQESLTKFLHPKNLLEVKDQFPPEKKKRKTNKPNNPVFKVTLPVTQGSLLVERTSFSKDNLPLPLTPLPTDRLGPCPLSDSADSVDFLLNSSVEVFDSISKNIDHKSKYQQNLLTDLPAWANNHIKQEISNQNTDSFEENVINKTNVCSKAECVQEIYAPKPHYAQTPNLPHSEYFTHSYPWLGENERCAPPYYQQPPPYITPGLFPQCNMFLEHAQSSCRLTPQASDSFYYNNSVTVPDGNQSFSSYYAGHEADTNQYASYQVNSSGWGTFCCVPPPQGAAFSNADANTASSNAVFCPITNFYSSHKSPYFQ